MEQMNGIGKGDINSVEDFKTSAIDQLATAKAQLQVKLERDKDDILTIANLENRIKELEPLAKAEEEANAELEVAA